MKIIYNFPEVEDSLNYTIHRLYFENWKYKILWALRSLEAEIENDGKRGIIIIPDLESEEEFEVLGFPPKLMGPVRKLMLDIN